jgi:hypothetical protein
MCVGEEGMLEKSAHIKWEIFETVGEDELSC